MVMSRSMLLRFFLQQKQWARLFFGLTVARISPQWGQRKRKKPSLIFDGGPCRPRAAMVTGMGRSLRRRRSRSAEIMVFPFPMSGPSEVDEVGFLLPVG